MRIVLATTLLADDNLALGYVGPRGLTLNGQQIVEDAQFFRAATARFYARENLGTTLQFSVQRLFSSIKAAEVFALTHAGSVPTGGAVTAVCGEVGDQQSCYLEDAVLESVVIAEQVGTSVTVQYTIKGGIWTTDVPPDLPGSADSAEETIVMRRGKVAIGAGVNTKAVVFSSPLGAVPIVKAEVHVPSGGAAIGGTVLEDTITTNGFTYRLDAATPNADYVLHYIAVE